jgi:primosomal protein N' (replication factor Y)
MPERRVVTRSTYQPFLPSLNPDEPVARSDRVALVALLSPIDRLYSYSVPKELAEVLRPGQRVEVPIRSGKRTALGFCVGFSAEPWTSTLKPVKRVLDARPLLDPRLIELGLWMSRYYCCPPGRALAAMVPEPVRRQSGFRRVRQVRLLKPVGEIKAAHDRITPRQGGLIEFLSAADAPVELGRLKAELKCGDGLIRAAADRGWLAIDTTRRPVEGPRFDQPPEEPTFVLNTDQQQAIDTVCTAIDAAAFRVFLLFGVAGSGKTEVYVRAIRHAVAHGQQAIMLVPEIALTTQLVQRLARRFQDVAVIHSGLTGSQRSLIWADIAAGRKRVVIGTRSAVFAPTPRLGLIVVDEEQDSSYKNLQAPRFNSRDVAIIRAQHASIPILLGSATPSLETWFNAQRLPHYEVIRLPRRVADLPMPVVRVVPMQAERQDRGSHDVLSRPMEQQLQETLDRCEQAVLLLNRRGYASHVFCPRCGWTAVCSECDSALVYHKSDNVVRCHRCGRRQPALLTCPNTGCGGTPLRFGMGTQRVEEELHRKFPLARVARADSDTMTRSEHYENLIQSFEARLFDIIVGTQMIAKGLDFPLVSFVGVINADTALMLPDFRAGERTFQLVTQVAGRAGRAGGQGVVLVQTDSPDMACIRLAVKHDYEAFAAEELTARRKMRLPPAWRMARIVLGDSKDSKARSQGERLAEAIRDAVLATGSKLRCDGPAPCPIQRERNLYRYELLLRDQTAEGLGKVLDHIRGEVLQGIRVKQLTVDVDPISLL